MVLVLLPPATKLGQGNVFTGVCDSVNGGLGVPPPGGGGLLWGVFCSGGCLFPGGCLLWGVSAGGVSAPRGGCLLPGGLVETPWDGYCCGWYASYWNAFLFQNDVSIAVLQ